MTEAVNPTDLFKEELDHDDIAIRVNAVHRLKTVVTLIGGENFKNQLLPYLEGFLPFSDFFVTLTLFRTDQKGR